MKKKSTDSLSHEDFFQDLSIEFLIHELKDPIAVIETGTRTLLEKQNTFGSLSPRQERTVQRILRNTRKARDMLYSLLEVGRSEAGSFHCGLFKPVETALEVLGACLEMRFPIIGEEMRQQPDLEQTISFLTSRGIEVTVPSDMFQLQINQDVVKYRQILGNLIKNALHFKREWIKIQMSVVQDTLVVAVVDDGPGVAPEDCEAIFQRYAQSSDCTLTPRQGHGLGLAGARIMARCLGGDVELTCDAETGTMFKLTLPKAFSKH